MKVLMIHVGGSNVKLMNARDGEMRKIKSGKELTGQAMAEAVLEAVIDWELDRVSIGYPGLLKKARPVRDPLNLGGGWLNYDFEKAFGRPVRFINDAAMQALGNYVQGRLLFMGFGTSIGTCMIADDTVLPIEIGLIRFSKNERFMDRLSKEALKENGIKPWFEAVHDAVGLLQDVFHPDETVLGGGNAKLIDPLPNACRPVENASAYVGAERLWEDADLFASADESTWKIQRRTP
jgi:Transcriptional regulator/sugar kinase